MNTQPEPCNSLSYDEALRLLNLYGNGAPWIAHCVAVARLSGHLSAIFAHKYDIDTEFIRSASLLHDIGRYRTHDPVLHGVEGFMLLSDLGHPNEAFVCASHVLYGLEKAEASRYGLPEQDFIPVSFGERLIPLVDSLVEHDTPSTLGKRFVSLRRRYGDNRAFLEKIARAEKKARTLMEQLNDEFGISMEQLAVKVLSE